MNLTDIIIGVVIVGGAYYLYTNKEKVSNIIQNTVGHGDSFPPLNPEQKAAIDKQLEGLHPADKKCQSGYKWVEAYKGCVPNDVHVLRARITLS